MTLEIEALDPIGARLHGLELGAGLDDAGFEQLHAALLEHGVLVVPGQPLAMPEQVALGRRHDQRRPANMIRMLRVGPGLAEAPHDVQVPLGRSTEQWRVASILLYFLAGPSPQEARDDI